MVRLALGVCLALTSNLALAQPSPDFVGEALAAFRADAQESLKAMAERDDPDPWIIADALYRQGGIEAALAFARAATRPDLARLPAYLEGRRRSPRDPAVVAGVDVSVLALGPAEMEATLARLAELRGAQELYDRTVVEAMRGNLLGQLERYRESAEAYVEGATVAEQLGWLAMASRLFHQSGMKAHRLSDYEGMRFAWESMRRIEQGRDRPAGAARALMFIGNVQAELGDYEQALECYAEAEETFRDFSDLGGLAWLLNNVGEVYGRQGQYRKAQDTFERALRLTEKTGNAYRRATLISDLGGIYSTLGDYDRAERMHREALRIREQLEHRRGIADSIGNLGIVYRHLGRYEEALSHMHRALDIFEEDDERRRLCNALLNIGWVHMGMDDLGKALEYSRRALEEAEDVGDTYIETHALQNLAEVYRRLENYENARRLQDRGMRLAARLDSARLRMDGHFGLAKIHLDKGENARAVYAARRAIDELSRVTAGLAEEQGAIARARRVELYEVAARAAAEWGKPAALFEFLESGRAGALLESLESREEIRAASIPEALRREERSRKIAARAVLKRYQRAVSQGNRLEIRKRRGELDAAREAVRGVVERMQREAKGGATILYPEAAPLEVVQESLRTDEALVLYALLPENSVALVVTRIKARIVALGERETIEAAARVALDDRSADPSKQLATLRELVVEPLGLGPETRRLLVSPDGILGYVPLALLCGEREIAYVPSGTTYTVLLGGRHTKGRQVLALGDPAYPAASTAASATARRSGIDLSPLPATREEARRVGDVVLLGPQATKSRLRSALRKQERWLAVHLACHGLVDRERPMLSGLVLAADDNDTGLLTCEDIFGMSIPADLAVLSACETAKGKIYRAEGIVGLTRAFMFAGAPRVIVSLWKVDDEATRALMTRFYELWNPKSGNPGLPAATALRKAQEHVRSQEKWQHPFYWAAWQLWGLPE